MGGFNMGIFKKIDKFLFGDCASKSVLEAKRERLTKQLAEQYRIQNLLRGAKIRNLAVDDVLITTEKNITLLEEKLKCNIQA